ncbi:hypothetical protein CCHR01_13816 [Colletotrichum chrysophilum]|uniref:Uncharacterized protein n=1 Tax=Colletotrichum chrysophilum TaxID=1836956 RepID=A0AAD9A8N8_9PEZI|nr:hypothetical protein CCHR01_13816 [Colletotrichum chrysophilum]
MVQRKVTCPKCWPATTSRSSGLSGHASPPPSLPNHRLLFVKCAFRKPWLLSSVQSATLKLPFCQPAITSFGGYGNYPSKKTHNEREAESSEEYDLRMGKLMSNQPIRIPVPTRRDNDRNAQIQAEAVGRTAMLTSQVSHVHPGEPADEHQGRWR